MSKKKEGDHMKKKQSAERTFSAMAADMAANPKTGAPPNKPVYMLKRIGSTTYKVAVHFPPDVKETAAAVFALCAGKESPKRKM